MRRTTLLLALVLPLAVACGGSDSTQPTPTPPPPTPPPPSPPPPPAPAAVASVAVAPNAVTLVPQQTAQLSAETRDSSGNVLTGRAITWAVDTVGGPTASVNDTGLVTALTPGDAMITATSESQSGSVTVTVADGGFILPAGTAFAAGGGRVTIDAPAGAVAVGTAVLVSPLAAPPANPGLVDSSAWQLGPDSLTFAQPVTVRLTWLDGQLPADAVLEQIRVHRYDGSAWVPLANASVDTTSRAASGTTTSFSAFALIELPSNPVPALAALAPTSVDAGSPALELSVTGTGFVETSVVRWNGTPRNTTFQSATELTAQITAADLAAAGTAEVTVFSPAPRGGTTAPLSFTILTPPPPTATFVVTTTASAGAGSLRQAILDANSTPGTDSIHFSIPGAGPHTIQLLPALPSITDPVVIDGFTQPGATPNTNPVGAINAVLRIELDGLRISSETGALTITAGSSTVRGLVINRSGGDGIRLSGGGGNVIEGNALGTNVTGSAARGSRGSGLRGIDTRDNRIGGTTPAARNLISGNDFHGIDFGGSGSTGNRIEGNLIGPNAAATAGLGGVFGVFLELDASDNVIGGTAPGAGNVISGNGNAGIWIRSGSANRIAGNYIGTDPTGTVRLANGGRGVLIEDDAVDNVVGGTSPAARNVISGNGREGVQVRNGGESNRIEGNYIGTDVTGSIGMGNERDGVVMENTAGTIIGGTVPGAGNVIAFNRNDFVSDGAGIRVSNGSTGIAILGNAIYSNVGLGIELGTPGVAANDLGDADTGPNNLQNFPVLTAATLGSTLSVTGTLDAAVSTTFRIEFFANDVLDPSGHGEGQRFIGFVDVTTDASGNAAITAELPAADIIAGNFITATATDADGNTSEFSAGVVVPN